MGAVLGVPLVFEPGEGFRGVSGAKSEMTLCIVRFRFCKKPAAGISRLLCPALAISERGASITLSV